MSRSVQVIIAGGGTGGHVFPGIAVAQELVKKDSRTRLLFVGTDSGLECEHVPNYGFELRTLSAGRLRGQRLWVRLQTIVRAPQVIWRAIEILREFCPRYRYRCGGVRVRPYSSRR